MRRLSYVLPIAVLGMSLSACLVATESGPGRPAASGPHYRNHGHERSAEVHERNAERKADKHEKHH
jgi:hypothetical protein